LQYLLSFLEGMITFISPCLLPMLPIYLSYFAGGSSERELGTQGRKTNGAVLGALGFVLGFTIVFVALGAFAGSLGKLLTEYQTAFNIIGGMIVVLFGLNFMGILQLPFLGATKRFSFQSPSSGFFPSLLFGMIFSIGWTPCVGAFLGSALMLAAQSGKSMEGVFLLLSFSAGLGIPFVTSAVLIDKLKGAFDFIKRNYKIVNLLSGGILVLVGVLMATGYMGYLLSLFTF